ncbi:MAG TPA: NUDIX domain-containing protein [Patescibacteria group bacterium]
MKQGAGVLVIKDGKVLLVKAGVKSGQINGTMSFPGGNVEPGETAEETARREFTEETGLVAGELKDFPGNYVEASLELKQGMVDYSFKVFLTNEFSGDLKATEETEPIWTELAEARKMKLLGKNNKILEEAIKFLKPSPI